MDHFDFVQLWPELQPLLEKVAALVKEGRLAEAENYMLRVKDLILQNCKSRPPGWN